jgi:FeS assembly protein SufD
VKNLYQAWTEFNKIQNQVLQGAPVVSLLQSIEESVESWKEQPYPSGEDWKYVKFQDLPTTHFRWPKQDQPNEQVADQDFYSFEINNFSTPQKFAKLSLPRGLQIVSELEEGPTHWPSTDAHNPFQNFSTSFYGLGFYLNIDKSYSNDKPIRLVFDLDKFTEKDLFLQQSLRIRLHEGAAANLLLEVRGQALSGLVNLCVDVDCAPGSHLRFLSTEIGGPQSHFMLNLQGTVQRQALWENYDITLPGQWSRHNLVVNLVEEQATVDLKGVYLNNHDHFVDHHTAVFHRVGHTESREDYRGILTDKAQAVFNGKVVISKMASQSNSEQINKNLMLSKLAEVDTKPELQIYNDDVKAAHGATVGQIDEEQRFYLQSRGYTEKEAGQVLSKAFVYGLLDGLPEPMSCRAKSEMERVLESWESPIEL